MGSFVIEGNINNLFIVWGDIVTIKSLNCSLRESNPLRFKMYSKLSSSWLRFLKKKSKATNETRVTIKKKLFKILK
jgi:hypothetical protein